MRLRPLRSRLPGGGAGRGEKENALHFPLDLAEMEQTCYSHTQTHIG